MKHVGIEELKDHVAEYFTGNDVLAIERHGVPLGYFWPASKHSRKGSKEAKEALDRLEQTVQRVLDETGMTEDELASLFDLSVPVEDAIDAIERRRERTRS